MYMQGQTLCTMQAESSQTSNADIYWRADTLYYEGRILDGW